MSRIIDICSVLPSGDEQLHTLYLGSYENLHTMFLIHNKIGTVINLAKECNPVLPKELNIDYYKFGFVDSIINFYEVLDSISQLIKRRLEYGSVFVHCMAGRSRSATIILAYLMKVHRLNLHYSFSYVFEKRSILPHPNFMRALMRYEKEIFGTESCVDYIDSYSVEYLMTVLDIPLNDMDNVKREYELCDKDYDRTEKKLWDEK
jgi:hypothetical protein